MGTIFVAYGRPQNRNTVLRFAARQAASCDHELFVYHIHESAEDSVTDVREEAETVLDEATPQVPFTVHINTPNGTFGPSTASKSERLLDAILETDPDYEYVVMGDIERGSLEALTHDSLTEAILRTHSIPVMLVPVGE